MSVNSELFDILLLRTSPQYHAAEVMRRQLGADTMAASPQNSDAYAAVRLLIGTWEVIAKRVKGNGELRIAFYDTNPVGHMWNALEPGISIIRTRDFKGKASKHYAEEFQRLNRHYGTWLKKQPQSYRSAAMDGIAAQFG
jgi:hypothetical protein